MVGCSGLPSTSPCQPGPAAAGLCVHCMTGLGSVSTWLGHWQRGQLTLLAQLSCRAEGIPRELTVVYYMERNGALRSLRVLTLGWEREKPEKAAGKSVAAARRPTHPPFLTSPRKNSKTKAQNLEDINRAHLPAVALAPAGA